MKLLLLTSVFSIFFVSTLSFAKCGSFVSIKKDIKKALTKKKSDKVKYSGGDGAALINFANGSMTVGGEKCKPSGRFCVKGNTVTGNARCTGEHPNIKLNIKKNGKNLTVTGSVAIFSKTYKVKEISFKPSQSSFKSLFSYEAKPVVTERQKERFNDQILDIERTVGLRRAKRARKSASGVGTVQPEGAGSIVDIRSI